MHRAAIAAVTCGVLASACGSAPAATPPPTVIVGTPTVSSVALRVTLTGEPTRTFGSGHWHVCDHGTVANPSTLVAHDVRVVVTYLVHGVVDGQTTRAQAPTDGGALGDLQPGEARDFTVCGYSRNEPDRDVVSAAPAS
jgi:hypothetical protein